VPPGTQEAAAPRLERIIGDLPSKDYFLKLLDRPHYAYKVDEVGAVLKDMPEDPLPPQPTPPRQVSYGGSPR
jgi:hypothetical protein